MNISLPKVISSVVLALTMTLVPMQASALANVPMCKSNPLSYSWQASSSFAPNTFCIYSDASNTQIKFLSDGNLVWQKQRGTTIWASNTAGAGKSLIFNRNGNLQIKNAAGQIIWNANSRFGVDHNDNPTGTCRNQLDINHNGSDIFIEKILTCGRSGHLDWEVHL